MRIDLFHVNPFYMDRMVNFMYHQEYSTSDPTSLPHLQKDCQLAPDTFICIENVSPLELEVRMYILALDLSFCLQEYVLMKIEELLEKGVTMEAFAKAVEIAHAPVDGDPWIKHVLATYAAPIDHNWDSNMKWL